MAAIPVIELLDYHLLSEYREITTVTKSLEVALKKHSL